MSPRVTVGRPRPARGRFGDGRTMAEVLHAEALQRATRTLLTLRLVKMRIESDEDLAPPIDADELQPERAPAAPAQETCAGHFSTADDGGGCEAPAADGGGDAAADVPSGGPATGGRQPARSVRPANAGEHRPPRIDLAAAPSGMEAAAERWRSPVRISEAVAAERAEQIAAGKAWCKCGGADGGYVPASFGRNCIEAVCPLRGVTA